MVGVRFLLGAAILAMAIRLPAVAAAGEGRSGDIIESPFFIVTTPYSVVGTTVDFTNDYDEACPYSGSTAPDVVYQYTPSQEVLATADLCGSSYDTKMYIYDSSLSLIACNDDFYVDLDCGVNVSKIEYVHLDGGETYYLIVDGYGALGGEYHLEFSVVPALHLAFPAAGFLEGEPDLIAGYIDEYNGDQAHAQSILQSAMPNDPYVPPYLCESGWGAWFSDQDWFVIDEPGPGTVESIVVMTESPILVEELYGEFSVVRSDTVLPGEVVEFEVITSDWCLYLRVTAIPCAGQSDPDEVVRFRYRLQEPNHFPEYDLLLGGANDRCVGLAPVPAFHTIETVESYGFFWYEGDTGSGQFTNDYDAGQNGCLVEAADGPDVVIELFLWEDPLTVRLIAEGWPAVAYLVTDCGDPGGSCVAATDSDGSLYFDPPDDLWQAGYYYLVVDGYGGASGPFELEGDFRYPQGFIYGWWPYGTLPTNDLCAGARPLGEGSFTISQLMGIAHNDYDPGDEGCTGWGDTGMDVVYYADLVPGQILDVTMTTDTHWDDSLYLVTDCADPIGSCVAGADADPDGSHFTYTATAAGRYYLIVDSYDIDPNQFTLTGSITTAVGLPSCASRALEFTCQPNPCNPRTVVRYSLPGSAVAHLRAYDIRGCLVRTLVAADEPAGPHELAWDGRDDAGAALPSGTYVLRLEAGDEVRSLRVSLVR